MPTCLAFISLQLLMLKGKKRGLKRQSLLADLKTDPPYGIVMSLRGDWIIVNKHKCTDEQKTL